MPQSIAMQHASNQPFVFIGSLNQKPSFWSLSSKRRAGYVPLQDEPIANSSQQHLTDEAKPKRRGPISSIRDSIAGLDISQKVKQVVGRKRSRDDEADETEPILERPVKAARPSRIGSAFWTKYRELRGHHNAIEAMAEASSVAHAYDEQHGLDRRLPSPLESRSDEDDSPGWPGGDIDALQRYLNSVTVDNQAPQPDFGWAGKEIDDFRLYVRSADDDMLWEGSMETIPRDSVIDKVPI